MKKYGNNIDFVLAWVDGSDPAWISEKEKYQSVTDIVSNGLASQYRDWDTLRYWFRAVEKYAPWVNKIHFVTCGQKPKWLNTSHQKIHMVSHTDYIPQEYLPTFSSHVIELFLHKIPDLSEQFVYFNDDMFINKPVTPADFFNQGRPVDCALMASLSPSVPGDPFTHYLANDISVVNCHFKKHAVLRKNIGGWFSYKYGTKIINNMVNSLSGGFSSFYNTHMPQSYLKSTFEEVWNKNNEILAHTAKHKFRDRSDVNQYVFRYWQFTNGNFSPCSPARGRFYTIGENNSALFKDILDSTHKLICINDSVKELDFTRENEELVKCLDKVYPHKSSFEI